MREEQRIDRSDKRPLNQEMDEKLKITEFLKQRPACLKPMKLTKVATQEIMSELLTHPQVSLLALHGVSCYYQTGMLIVYPQKRTFVEISPQEQEETTCIVTCCGGHAYRLAPELTKEQVYDTYLRQESYECVLKPVGRYKMAELTAIAAKLGLNLPVSTKKYTKNQWYSAIVEATIGHCHLGEIQ